MFMLMHATGSEECNSIIAITVTYCRMASSYSSCEEMKMHTHTIAIDIVIEVFTYDVSVPVLE